MRFNIPPRKKVKKVHSQKTTNATSYYHWPHWRPPLTMIAFAMAEDQVFVSADQCYAPGSVHRGIAIGLHIALGCTVPLRTPSSRFVI